MAAEALDSTNSELNLDADILRRFLSVTAPLLPIVRFGARFLTKRAAVIGAALVLLREVASSRLKQIVVRQAANDATITVLRRAAANEARFFRTGTF